MKKKILVVEDDPSMGMIVKRILESHYHVIVANNGLSAIHWLSEGNLPDLILTDINMPIIDGKELITNLKRSGLYRNIPIIILTANDKSMIQENFNHFKCEDYIFKPFEPMILKQKVKNILENLYYD
ncbi:response regulator [Chondrinema litorale]|uniref:response regulator n=1 Tax=Chondrinema litorale TaxID=2994555 RepID=UPI0025436D24|nr:response regulator [Chondrinema litorale]UZS00112.1 response regulator [Chondrinema litorale]